jgi:hypothetical protein
VTAAPTLAAGRTAWRIAPKTSYRAASVLRCVVMRIRPDGQIEVAPSLLSGEQRLVLPPTEVFADRDAAATEAHRRHMAAQEPPA